MGNLFYIFVAAMVINNFTLTYFGIKGNLKRVWKNEEFRKYVALVVIVTLITSLVVYFVSDDNVEKSFRDALFQVVAIMTTTGYVSADYTNWTPFLTVLFFLLMFVGGMAGSTAGNVKIR